MKRLFFLLIILYFFLKPINSAISNRLYYEELKAPCCTKECCCSTCSPEECQKSINLNSQQLTAMNPATEKNELFPTLINGRLYLP